MLYVVKTDVTLFNRVRALEQKFNANLHLAGVIQNDMLIPSENLNESFQATHKKVVELQSLYLPTAIAEIIALQLDIKKYVIKCTLEASEDTIKQLCNYGNQSEGQVFDFNEIMSEINKTRDFIQNQKQTI